MKRIWLQNESDKLFADRQWCEDKVWDDEDCTAYIPEDEAQAIIDEAVELMREYDRETFHVKLPKKLRARLDDFIAKHGKDREEG